jgi:hypothetical protein
MQIKLFWGDEMEDNTNHFLNHIPSKQVHDIKLAATQFGRFVMVIYEED